LKAASPRHDCGSLARHLSDYIDGDLAADLRVLIDRHRSRCPPCAAFVRTLERTVELVRARPARALPRARVRALAAALRKAAAAAAPPRPAAARRRTSRKSGRRA
jgi:anti-sigma factor RsiW